MLQNNILINTETRKIKGMDFDFLGVAGENEIEQLVFKLTAFIDGIAILEIKKGDNKFFLELEKQDESYVLDIKNSLLSDVSEIFMQLHITTINTEVFKSKTFAMKVYEQIHATETIPDEYPNWIDNANAKIAELNQLEETIEEAEKSRAEAEQQRNETVQNAIDTIHDLTEDYNENAKQKTQNFNDNYTEKLNTFNENATAKTNEYNQNAQEKTNTFNQNAGEKTEELNEIAEGIEDMTTAIQFANFEVDNNMHLNIIQAEKLKNTNFIFNPENGRLGVRIVNG